MLDQTVEAQWPADPLAGRRGGLEEADEDDPDGWGADVDALLRERELAHRRPDLALPQHLSVTSLVELRHDPQALARRLARPRPTRPDLEVRRGTAFHSWVQRHYGSWADRTPAELEVPFEISVAGTVVRGRIDAVFGPDVSDEGTWTVVDWKTGHEPSGAEMEAAAVQLAAYRHAWAALQGIDPSRVNAVFHYV
ncbi:DNA helicase, UvrD/REP type like protein, partial [Aduncisulcus paluster]